MPRSRRRVKFAHSHLARVVHAPGAYVHIQLGESLARRIELLPTSIGWFPVGHFQIHADFDELDYSPRVYRERLASAAERELRDLNVVAHAILQQVFYRLE